MKIPDSWIDQKLSNDRYHVLEKLGEGGMGVVYRALDGNLRIDVVVKAPKISHLDDELLARRFLGEIRSLINLTHRHVVRILYAGEHNAVPFAVMEFLSGGSLKKRRPVGRDGRPLPQSPESLQSWLPQVAAALDFAHGRNWLHRDVKPDNILFDANGNAYLSDFGLAKLLAELSNVTQANALTSPMQILGTEGYMAPETMLRKPLDGKSDQYSLAVTVYEILAGSRPFEGLNPLACALKPRDDIPAPLERVVPGIPQGVAQAVRTALAFDPDRRFPSCEAFSRAVLTGMTQVEVVSVPPEPDPQVQRATEVSSIPITAESKSNPEALSTGDTPLGQAPRVSPARPERARNTPTVASALVVPQSLEKPRRSKPRLPPIPKKRRQRQVLRGRRYLWAFLALTGATLLSALLLLKQFEHLSILKLPK